MFKERGFVRVEKKSRGKMKQKGRCENNKYGRTEIEAQSRGDQMTCLFT